MTWTLGLKILTSGSYRMKVGIARDIQCVMLGLQVELTITKWIAMVYFNFTKSVAIVLTFAVGENTCFGRKV